VSISALEEMMPLGICTIMRLDKDHVAILTATRTGEAILSATSPLLREPGAETVKLTPAIVASSQSDMVIRLTG
jgi:hypothetical protein